MKYFSKILHSQHSLQHELIIDRRRISACCKISKFSSKYFASPRSKKCLGLKYKKIKKNSLRQVKMVRPFQVRAQKMVINDAAVAMM